MKVSSSTYLKLLAPLLASLLTMAEDVRPDGGLALAAEKEAKKATAEVLATCESGDEFLVSVFESTDDDVEYTETFQGCYMEAKNNDDDYELSIFTIEGNQTAGGPAFYASDNSGSLEEVTLGCGSITRDKTCVHSLELLLLRCLECIKRYRIPSVVC